MKVNGAKLIVSFFIVIGMIYIVGFWGTSVEKVSYASAYMYAQDRHFIGTVNFSEKADGVEIVIDCNNVPPGIHGLHIHEYGNCSDDQFECAGGHFNPTNQQHGSLTSEQRHLGDLGNVEASEQGALTTTFFAEKISLNGHYSILGRSVVIHEQEDDGVTQPTGNSGKRIACGIIGVAQEENCSK